MNPVCPVCETDLLESATESDPVPIEENDKIGTLHFCSDECRDRYVDTETERSEGSDQ